MANLSYIHKVGLEPLKALSLGSLLETAAIKFSEREAVISLEQNQRLTYYELLRQADQFAAGLCVLGVEKNDRIGIWAPNVIEWVVINMACVRGGFLSVFLNPFQQAQELQCCINKVGIKMIVCPREGKNQNFYEVLTTIAPELSTSKPGKLNSNKIPTLKGIILISDEEMNGAYTYDQVMKKANAETVTLIQNSQNLIQPDSPCYIHFTSGTTADPKAAVSSHFQVVNSSYFTGIRNELDQKHHKISVQVPFFHVYGTVATIGCSLNFGATMVLPSAYYSPTENLRAIKEEKCTIIYGTPTMFVDLINEKIKSQVDINPEIGVTAAAPCTPELIKKMKITLNLKRVKVMYGLSEATGAVFQILPFDENEYHITSTVGVLSDHIEAKVVDPEGNIVPFGTRGELCVRGYSNMLEYCNDEEKTKEIIGLDKWLKTGDQFVLDQNGYGKVVGRLKDIITRGGENIYPKEIEDFLSTHPHILEVHVIGLPHDRLGEEVCACVRLREGQTLIQNDIVEHLEGKISFFKIPSKLKVVEGFPKTTSGKVLKRLLVDQFASEGQLP